MTALIYTLLFAGVLCVGAFLGFLIASFLGANSPRYEADYHRLVEENRQLRRENNSLREDTREANDLLDKIQAMATVWGKQSNHAKNE